MPELNGPQGPEGPEGPSLVDYIQTETFQKHLQAILPSHLNSERFASVCLRQLGQVPELQNCSLKSVIGGMMTAATLGLEIGTQGECWLIPYKREAQLQVGVWGHMALAWRSGLISDVQVDVVIKGDAFSFRKGTEGYLHHEPRAGRDLDRDPIEWVYAVVRTIQGGRIFDAFDLNWIERIRARSQAPNSPAWTNFFAEQAQAKALKKVLKLCPKSRDMARAITLDDEADAGASQIWEVDTSHLLPAEVALDPGTEKARAEMRAMGAKPSREPEPVAREKRAPAPQKAARADAGASQEPPQTHPDEPPPSDDAGGGLGWD